MKILLLEDEYTLRCSIYEFLSDLDYSVDMFSNSEDAFCSIYENSYDLLLLDVNVFGDMDGFELYEKVRSEFDKVIPTIFITALVDIEDLKKGYDLGCSDYIRKPFDLIELHLRIKSVIQNCCFKSSKKIIKLKNSIEYDTENFIIIKENEEIQLKNREKAIFEFLLKNRGNIVSVDMIRDNIWGIKDIDMANIRVQINNLKKKLDNNLIINIRGLGYKIDN